jgi:hypothetical protein
MNKDQTPDESFDVPRHFASRHQAIPPTPRDTLAVLRQAAERQAETSAPPFRSLFARWAFGAIGFALLMLSGWMIVNLPDKAPIVADAGIEILHDPDPGLDITEWDASIASLIQEVNETIVTLGLDDTDPEAWVVGVLNSEESLL